MYFMDIEKNGEVSIAMWATCEILRSHSPKEFFIAWAIGLLLKFNTDRLEKLLNSEQGWQVLDGLGKNRLKPPVKTVRKKQVLDSQNGQNYRMMFFLIGKFTQMPFYSWKTGMKSFLDNFKT